MTISATAIIIWLVVGAVAGWLAGQIVKGHGFGLVGNINDALNVTLPDPLGGSLALASIGNIVTWEFVGYNMLIFYSALRVVPASLYESAEIDCAGTWAKFRFVT